MPLQDEPYGLDEYIGSQGTRDDLLAPWSAIVAAAPFIGYTTTGQKGYDDLGSAVGNNAVAVVNISDTTLTGFPAMLDNLLQGNGNTVRIADGVVFELLGRSQIFNTVIKPPVGSNNTGIIRISPEATSLPNPFDAYQLHDCDVQQKIVFRGGRIQATTAALTLVNTHAVSITNEKNYRVTVYLVGTSSVPEAGRGANIDFVQIGGGAGGGLSASDVQELIDTNNTDNIFPYLFAQLGQVRTLKIPAGSTQASPAGYPSSAIPPVDSTAFRLTGGQYLRLSFDAFTEPPASDALAGLFYFVVPIGESAKTISLSASASGSYKIAGAASLTLQGGEWVVLAQDMEAAKAATSSAPVGDLLVLMRGSLAAPGTSTGGGAATIVTGIYPCENAGAQTIAPGYVPGLDKATQVIAVRVRTLSVANEPEASPLPTNTWSFDTSSHTLSVQAAASIDQGDVLEIDWLTPGSLAAPVTGAGGSIDYVNPLVHADASPLTSTAFGKLNQFTGTGQTNWNVALPDPAGYAGKVMYLQIADAASGMWNFSGSGYAASLWAKETLLLRCTGTSYERMSGNKVPMSAILTLGSFSPSQPGSDNNLDLSMGDLYNLSFPRVLKDNSGGLLISAGRFRIPRKGDWIVTFSGKFRANKGEIVQIATRVNGDRYALNVSSGAATSGNNRGDTFPQYSPVPQAYEADDTIDFCYYADTGTNLGIYNGTEYANFQPKFCLTEQPS